MNIETVFRDFVVVVVSIISFSSHGTMPTNPEFVFAIFATTTSRADLVERALNENILAYNINSESSIDIESKLVHNVKTRKDGRWVSVDSVPLPDVVYDFGVNKKSREKKEAVRSMKAQLIEENVPFINPDAEMATVNDKILFASIMHENLIPHPKTLEFSKTNLKSMIDLHDVLYLKPNMGSKGYGIIIVEKTTDEKNRIRYAVSYKIKFGRDWVTKRAENILRKNVYRAIRKAQKVLKRKKAVYLVQEGVKSFNYNGNQTDFRINVQRVDDGKAFVSGVFMRVGGNLSQGGTPADYREVLAPLVREVDVDVESIYAQVLSAALATHIALEAYTGKHIGELGIDAVVDNAGRISIIEANHKSGFPHVYLKKNPLVDGRFELAPVYFQVKAIDMAHEKYILDYARFLQK